MQRYWLRNLDQNRVAKLHGCLWAGSTADRLGESLLCVTAQWGNGTAVTSRWREQNWKTRWKYFDFWKFQKVIQKCYGSETPLFVLSLSRCRKQKRHGWKFVPSSELLLYFSLLCFTLLANVEDQNNLFGGQSQLSCSCQLILDQIPKFTYANSNNCSHPPITYPCY